MRLAQTKIETFWKAFVPSYTPSHFIKSLVNRGQAADVTDLVRLPAASEINIYIYILKKYTYEPKFTNV